jgi:hypothetical protein
VQNISIDLDVNRLSIPYEVRSSAVDRIAYYIWDTPVTALSVWDITAILHGLYQVYGIAVVDGPYRTWGEVFSNGWHLTILEAAGKQSGISYHLGSVKGPRFEVPKFPDQRIILSIK